MLKKNTLSTLSLFSLLIILSSFLRYQDYKKSSEEIIDTRIQLFELFDSEELQNNYSNLVYKAQYFELNVSKLNKIIDQRPSSILLVIPLSDGEIVLDLIENEPLGGNYSVKTSSGKTLNKRDDYVFYKGKIRGLEKSMAAVSFFNDHLVIAFSDEKGNHRISLLEENIYSYYMDSDLKTRKEFICLVEDATILEGTEIEFPENNSQSFTGNCVEIYFETDFETYEENGSSLINTENFILALFNEVQLIYNNEDIPISISEIFIWDTVDPYQSLNSSPDVLDEFGGQLEDDFNGRLAHLVTTRSIGGGFAWIDVLCGTHNTNCCCGLSNCGPYGVSGDLNTNTIPFPDFSWNVNVIAHELGHNFGSNHTHACVWNGNGTQIDDCGPEFDINFNEGTCYDDSAPILPDDGTMMSYCHLLPGVGVNFLNGFGDQPGALIYDNYINAACSTGSCNNPCFGDANGDGMINIIDLITVSANFGCDTGCTNGDANFDGVVNVLDIITVSSAFGLDCP